MANPPLPTLTPQADGSPQLTRFNPPGQPALLYNLGSYKLIVSRMITALRKQKVITPENGEQQPLIHFNVLAREDWTVAFLRAWATVNDVLAFYQERIINEGYIRTATERRSVLELVRAVGYELAPPISATTHLAFTVQDPGFGQKVLVPRGTAVQSVPPAFSTSAAVQDIVQGEASPAANLPVIFETTDDLLADPAWNALKPSFTLGLHWPPPGGSPRSLRLTGATLGLKPGDALLVVGSPKSADGLPAWELLLVSKVNSQAKEGFTGVEWAEQFGTVPDGGIAQPSVYVLRRKAALFPYVAGGVFRSTDVGWAPVDIGLPPKAVQAAAADSEGRLYAGIEQTVYSSGDRGDSWQPIASGLPQKDVYAIATGAGETVAVGGADSAVHRSTDGGESWKPLSGPGEVEIPSGWRRFVDSVRYKLPKTKIRSLLFSGGTQPELLAGSDDGVFGYDAGQDEWISMNEHLPELDRKKGTAPLAVRALAAVEGGKRVLAGTSGGVFPVESLFKGPSPAVLIALFAVLIPGAISILPVFLQSVFDANPWLLPLGVLIILLVWQQPFRQKWVGVLLFVFMLFMTGSSANAIAAAREASSAPLALLFSISSNLVQTLIVIFLGWMMFSAALEKLPGLVQKYLPWLVPTAKSPQVFALLVDGAVVYAGTDQGIYQLDPRTLWVRLLHWGRHLLFGPEPEPWSPVAGWPVDLAKNGPADGVVMALTLDGQGRLMAGTQAGNLYVRQAGAAPTWVAVTNSPLAAVRALVKTKNDLFAVGEPLDLPQETRWAPAQLEAGAVDVDTLSLASAPGPYAVALDLDRVALFRVTGGVEQASLDAKKPGKLTRLSIQEKAELPGFDRATTMLFCQSEPLALFDDQFQPHPVQGDQIVLAGRVTGLQKGKLLVIAETMSDGQQRSEAVTLIGAIPGETSTILQLETSLAAAYDRESTIIYGNVAPAIHGQTIRRENLGESDGTLPNQRFLLRSPLAFEPADANDYQSSLTVQVNRIDWNQVPSLLDQPAGARVFMVRRNDLGQTAIIFGDGEQGARLPTSREILTATYRSGGGEAGNLPPNSLTLPQTRLPFLKSVNNPEPAVGGQPEEPAGHGRERAPQRLRAMGRIVTLKDYRDFTATFPGVSRSAVHLVPETAPRWIDIAIAPRLRPEPDATQPDPLLTTLAEAINQSRSSAILPFKLRLYQAVFFRLGLSLIVDPKVRGDEDALRDLYQRVRQTILAAYNLETQELGRAVTETEIFQRVQAVRGVTALTLTRLQKLVPGVEENYPASPELVLAADWDEMLLVNPDVLEVEVAL